ncbi:hypothetical protein F5Y17DRAFT_475941 [Xylariaceae sp. FL0594]|nr:hypothetical protein F5Y17DRAFT_475941 [Xylariaceae sp. FL0594]
MAASASMESDESGTKRPRLNTSLPSYVLPPPGPGGTHPHHPGPSQYHNAPYSRAPEQQLAPTRHQLSDERHPHQQSYDHDPYRSMHEPPRQLPHSPAQPQYRYSPRQPILKRDSGEESGPSQFRRPSSTTHPAEGLSHPPSQLSHGLPHANQHYPEDTRRPMSFDNGASVPHSSAMYRPPSQSHSHQQPYHAPATPVTQQPPYELPHTYGHQPIYAAPLEIQSASAKRKPQRASQACDNCRQLKAKCDEARPCKNCSDKNTPCHYRDLPAKQPDKMAQETLDTLRFLRDEVKGMKSDIDRKLNQIGKRLSVLEHGSKQGNAEDEPMKLESIEQDDPAEFSEASVSDMKDGPEEDATEDSTPGPHGVVKPDMSPNEALETLRRGEEDDVETNPGPMVQPGRPTMPANHTTLAGLLLKWRSISSLVEHILEAENIRHVQEYPILIEQTRGGLRIFGRGEGQDNEPRTSDKGTPQNFSMTDTEDGSEAYPTPPASGQELWGQVGSPSYLGVPDQKGGSVTSSDGSLFWDPSKVWKYVQSFKDNILNMHPIIIPKELDAMVTVFLETLPKPSNVLNSKTSKPGFVVPSSTTSSSLPEASLKRKRSPVSDEPQQPSQFSRKPGRPYRNVQSTLVLLVLALGKICLHRGKIPDVIHDTDDALSNSPLMRNGTLASPGQGSPPGQKPPSQSSGLPSPKDMNATVMMSRRSSVQGNRTSPLPRRNMDVIPGLEFFALASDIMGADYGAFGLKHVHVHILAGLYHGQLGRVLDSWEHITSASRKLQVVLRPSLSRLSDMGITGRESRRDNQLALAFWTCLQLESDILAELPLPQSGILQYENQMPYPNTNFITDSGFPAHVGEGYMAQLYLRKQLNKVHTLLYHPDKRYGREHIETTVGEVQEIQQYLRDARDATVAENCWVPPHYQWSDRDPLATDLLSARLRAKYWGSQVIIYRPFLRHILEEEAIKRQNTRPSSPEPRSLEELGERRVRTYGERTIEYAKLAIQALIESTRAFHGIDTSCKRIIITNHFGTAHAQWGNCLTLSACYRDEHLRQWIDKDLLAGLFQRTIQFFRTIALPNSALMTDMNILIRLAKDLDLYTEPPVNASFSSVSSAGPPPALHPSGLYYDYPPQATSPTMMRP